VKYSLLGANQERGGGLGGGVEKREGGQVPSGEEKCGWVRTRGEEGEGVKIGIGQKDR